MPTKKKEPESSTKKQTLETENGKQESTAAKPENSMLPGLMKGLQSVFDKIHKDNRDRDHAQEKIIEEFTQSLNKAFDQVHTEAQERQQLLEEKLETIEKEQSYRIQRIKILSFPGTIIATIALLYLFYVVHIMERSMTSISEDMNHLRGSVAMISGNTNIMSDGVVNMNNQMVQMNSNMSNIDQQMADMNSNMENIDTHVAGMNGNMTHLNRSVGVMTNDVGAMSQSVSPVMSGMRNFMPFF
jgi:uncharacterized protein YoxC